MENIFSDIKLFNYLFFSDEREDVQKKTFAKWINSQLIKVRTMLLIFIPFIFKEIRYYKILKIASVLSKQITCLKINYTSRINSV